MRHALCSHAVKDSRAGTSLWLGDGRMCGAAARDDGACDECRGVGGESEKYLLGSLYYCLIFSMGKYKILISITIFTTIIFLVFQFLAAISWLLWLIDIVIFYIWLLLLFLCIVFRCIEVILFCLGREGSQALQLFICLFFPFFFYEFCQNATHVNDSYLPVTFYQDSLFGTEQELV